MYLGWGDLSRFELGRSYVFVLLYMCIFVGACLARAENDDAQFLVSNSVKRSIPSMAVKGKYNLNGHVYEVYPTILLDSIPTGAALK